MHRNREVEFVVHLHHELRLEVLLAQTPHHLVHRDLDDVGRAPLHGVVHGRTLPEAALLGVLRLELGDVALTAEHGRRVPALLRVRHRVVEVRPHTRIRLEVTIDHLLGLAEGDVEALGEPVGLLAVHDSEVHRLRAAAQLRRHLLDGKPEHARGRGGVEVGAGVERRHEVLVARKMREQTQLDLGVVGREEQRAFLKRHEARADAASEIGAHGDVLQVGIR